MGSMDGWDLVLFVVAGYLAAVTLVRLMIRRRDQMLDEFRKEVEQQKRRGEAPKGTRPRRQSAA